jgi:hypothetical protein
MMAWASPATSGRRLAASPIFHHAQPALTMTNHHLQEAGSHNHFVQRSITQIRVLQGCLN